uniref:Uncharacterized protein n=1 Tax=Mesocestoides corti TaxID=53468 RepID=A0A5K3G1E7_MESCO
MPESSGYCGVEYRSPNRKKIGTTEQTLLTDHKPEPQARCLPSQSTLSTPLIIYCTSLVSFSGWLLIFLTYHWNAENVATVEYPSPNR